MEKDNTCMENYQDKYAGFNRKNGCPAGLRRGGEKRAFFVVDRMRPVRYHMRNRFFKEVQAS